MGGEAEKKAKQELRELTIALNEAETENAMTGIKLNKQRKMLNRQEAADAKELADTKKEAAKTAHDNSKTLLEDELKNEKLNFQQRRDLINANKLITLKERQKLLEEVNKDEKKLIEEHNKAIKDLNKKYDDLKLDDLAKTNQDKLDLDMQRKLDEINFIAQTQKEKDELYAKWNEEYDRRQKELNNNELLNEQEKNLKKANDIKLTTEERLLAIQTRVDNEKNIIFKSEDEKLAYEKATSEAKIKLAEEEAAAKQKALQSMSSGLKTAATLLGESTAAGKAAAIAATTIDTIQSGVSAFKGMVSAIPGPVGIALGAVAAAGALASGYASVKKILAVKTPNGGGGGAAPSGGGVSAPSFNVVGNSGVNQLAETMAGKSEQAPIKAYVVSNDVTSAQGLDRKIITNASLG
jgi:hypothetical protein